MKVIDFGLAMKRTLLADTSASLSSHNRTVVGESIAGSVHYAAPEQMGQLPGVAVGPYTDVYAFGKTCCHALFKTTAPLPKHWRSLPAPLADLLEQCLNERPEERLPGFRAVLERLQQLHSPAAKSPPPSVAEPPRPTAKPPAPPPSEDGGTWLEAAFGGLFAPVEKVAKATLGGLFGKGETGASQAPKGLTVQAAPANLRDLEKRIGESFYFEVTGDPNGLLWGTDVYTSDSSPATAAVHAGIVRAGEKGVVQVTLVKPLSSYAGTTRNGVTSRPWESWPGAFRIAAVPVVERATPARLWKVGDRVLAPWGREWWYAGTVQEQKADHVRVKFDDGDEGWSAAGLVRPLAFAVGAKVHARSKDEADYRPGWVVREQQHDLLIQFEGGGQDWRPLKWVRVAPLV